MDSHMLNTKLIDGHRDTAALDVGRVLCGQLISSVSRLDWIALFQISPWADQYNTPQGVGWRELVPRPFYCWLCNCFIVGKYGSTGVCWPMTHFTIGVYDIVELGCIDDGLSEVSAFNSDPYGVGCIQNDISGMNTEANYMNNNSTIVVFSVVNTDHNLPLIHRSKRTSEAGKCIYGKDIAAISQMGGELTGDKHVMGEAAATTADGKSINVALTNKRESCLEQYKSHEHLNASDYGWERSSVITARNN
ncbi:hypothetical protein F9C07_2212509 [Aspergillus flavus]|uniref:Uncharacterized protein n=1 Tax=Aspergillus flavus (strain ATCC 200026 / FGSC A1120 / IAM 13836 / NRRL 3357 / JCM 12722 / SRRC 167) TaxID=332952 RepID=A0A7U2QZA1_ASPFN|nr:hypothetical protein F9C07_2212509 [Aspergillus flavus]